MAFEKAYPVHSFGKGRSRSNRARQAARDNGCESFQGALSNTSPHLRPLEKLPSVKLDRVRSRRSMHLVPRQKELRAFRTRVRTRVRIRVRTRVRRYRVSQSLHYFTHADPPAERVGHRSGAQDVRELLRRAGCGVPRQGGDAEPHPGRRPGGALRRPALVCSRTVRLDAGALFVRALLRLRTLLCLFGFS